MGSTPGGMFCKTGVCDRTDRVFRWPRHPPAKRGLCPPLSGFPLGAPQYKRGSRRRNGGPLDVHAPPRVSSLFQELTPNGAHLKTCSGHAGGTVPGQRFLECHSEQRSNTRPTNNDPRTTTHEQRPTNNEQRTTNNELSTKNLPPRLNSPKVGTRTAPFPRCLRSCFPRAAPESHAAPQEARPPA